MSDKVRASKYLVTMLLFVCLAESNYGQAKNSIVTISIPGDAVLIGREKIESAKWPRKLMDEPSDEGQFEILIRTSAQSSIGAPSCSKAFLLVRMPGMLSTASDFAEGVKARKQTFDSLLDSADHHKQIELRLNSFGYGHVDRAGKLQLTGCNIWFARP
jgi:hypothetical protein